MTQGGLLSKLTKESSMNEIQEYIQTVTELRGFGQESVQETMLLLLEETGELAKAIRKAATDMPVDTDKMQNYGTVESEAADVFFVLASVCNQLNINLFEALKEKERINCERNWSPARETASKK